MKVTEFGVALRKIRLDRLLRLKEMADAAGISSAFLSSVETGHREIPLDLPGIIAKTSNLSAQDLELLNKKADETRRNTTIPMPDSDVDRHLIGAFARNLDSLDEARKIKILNMLEGEDV